MFPYAFAISPITSFYTECILAFSYFTFSLSFSLTQKHLCSLRKEDIGPMIGIINQEWGRGDPLLQMVLLSYEGVSQTKEHL